MIISSPPDHNRIMFLAPTIDLVHQMEDDCEKHCANRPLMCRLCSGEKVDRGKHSWDECLEDHNILVGTPEIFNQALTKHGYVSPLNFHLIIFDECPRARQQSDGCALQGCAQLAGAAVAIATATPLRT